MQQEPQLFTPPLTVRERGKAYYNWRMRRRKRRIFAVILVWTIVLAYLISPYSKARFTTIQGHLEILSESQLYELAELNPNQFWWEISSFDAATNLSNYRYISSASIHQGLFGLTLAINEIVPVGKYGIACEGIGSDKAMGGACSFYLSNGQMINGENNLNVYDNRHIQHLDRIPYLLDADAYSSSSLLSLLEQLGTVEAAVRQMITSISRNATYTQFEAINLQFDPLKSQLDATLTLIVDLDHLDEKLSSTRIDYLLDIIRTSPTSYQLPNQEYCIVNVDNNIAIPCAS